ncbi:MAG: hypothetical protein ACRYFX_28440 [Janthinobacterium lividum]
MLLRGSPASAASRSRAGSVLPGGLLVLLAAIAPLRAAAQLGDFWWHLKDTAFVRQHHLQSIRITRRDLREYAGHNKPNKHWQPFGQFVFNRDGTVKSFRGAGTGPKRDVPFYNGSQEHPTLDSLGRLRRNVFEADGKLIFDDAYEYDATGHLQRVLRTEPGQTAATLLQTYAYNDRGQETEQRTYPSIFNSPFPGSRLKFYDAQHQLYASEFRSVPSKASFSPYLDSVYYDPQGRVSAEMHYSFSRGPAQIVFRTRTTYDQHDRHVWQTREGFGSSNYVSHWMYNNAGEVLLKLEQHYTQGLSGETNHFEKFTSRYDDRGTIVEEKQYYANFVSRPQDIQERHLVENRRWKTTYYR